MGTVSLLSGQPMEGISVEARSESKGYYEETTTDSSGNFRLRGLLPDTSYSVKVAAKEDFRSARVERASPEFVEVKVCSFTHFGPCKHICLCVRVISGYVFL